MSAFDVFCLPSRWEGLGVVLLEAMAAGIPIVGSRHGAIPEVLDGGRAGLVFDPDDALGLASAVQSLLDDPRLASTLVASARERLSTAFSVEEMMRKTDEVYDRALRGEARRRRS
jgi:glycosyltransferase involved in cell wall biosynthesis